MKRVLLILIAGLISASSSFVSAQNNYKETASKQLYDFDTKFDPEKVIKYFKELNDNGKIFPTAEEFKDKFGVDPEFIRSHTKLRPVLKGDENPLLFPNLRENRHLWMNLPTGIGPMTGGYPSGQFDNDPYTMWQYTELFGSWNHSHLQAPGSWVDAAHKHGTVMLSGNKFFDTTGGRGQGAWDYISFITTRDTDGSFMYVKPLIHALMYLGQDGINYNWEAAGYDNTEVINFHKQLHHYAKSVGFPEYRQAIYTSAQSVNKTYISQWLYDYNTKEAFADIMLNYSGNDFSDTSGLSGSLVKKETGSYNHLYSGAWIVTMNRAFKKMEDVETNICLWGEHGQSRFVQFNTGNTATQKMSNYQSMYERAISGTSRNAAKKDPWDISDFEGTQLRTFGGLSRMIPERTTLKQNLPFQTYFNTGAGERYYYRGLTSSMSPWYSMGAQDYQPTYRWLQYNTGTKEPSEKVNVKYHYDDAYIGGSSLMIYGSSPTNGVDIILYRGLLTIAEGSPIAKVAVKKYKGNNNPNLSLIVHKKGDTDIEYKSYELKELSGKSWEEQEISLSGFNQGDIIDYIGLRLKGTDDNYETLVGGIGIYDDTKAEIPQSPNNIRAEVKAETQKSMSIKLSWEVSKPVGVNTSREKYGLLFNDELGINHFEIFYKDGENGKVKELGRTSSWATYVPTIIFEKTTDESNAEQPYIGVRSVATDLKTATPIKWLKITRGETFELPEFKDDRYCRSEINPKAEGYNTAITSRYLEVVRTTGATIDLNYTADRPETDGDNYVDATNNEFTVEQGQKLEFYFKSYSPGGNDDGLKWCWASTFIDWNNDGVFDPEDGEQIKELALGRNKAATPEFNTGTTANFTVPTDATPGKVRVRIVFSDAWFPRPVPCGFTAKGFTIDFDMTITGNNPGRKSTDTRDKGDVTELDEMVKLTPIDKVSISDNNYTRIYPNPVKDVLYLDNVDKAWVFTMDGKMIRFVSGQSNINVSDLPKGNYVVKTQKDNITRTHKVVKE